MEREAYQRLLLELGKAKLVAVSKNASIDQIETLRNWGQLDFGENRVQSLAEKSQYFHHKNGNELLRWHFIGKLQSKKINSLLKVPGLFSIHSIDSFELLQKLGQKLNERQQILEKIFLQVNLTGEAEKNGFTDFDQLLEAAKYGLSKLSGEIKTFGLMAMATWRTDVKEEEASRCFQETFNWKQKLEKKFKTQIELSMGMSSDYQTALKYHTDYVRIGRQLFNNT